MKDGWQTKALGDLLERTETADPTKTPGREFEYVDVSAVSNESFEITHTETLKGRDAPSRARRRLKAGDVIFATIRPTLRRIAIVPDRLNDQVCSTGYIVLRPRPEITARFLFYSLFTEAFMAHMQALQKGASYPAVSDSEVRAQRISFPAIPDQRRIVAILDEAFENIATAKANAKKNLENARAVFESQLQSVFSDQWSEYPVGTLSDLATDVTDGDHLPPPKSSTGVPFITIGNIAKETHQIDFGDTFMVPRAYFEALKASKKPQRNDVLYTVTGSFGIPVMVESDREFCFQRHIALIRPRADTLAAWLYFLLLSPQIFKQANDGATGTAQKTVSLRVLRGFVVPRPPLQSQREAADALAALSAETEHLASIYQRKLATLHELKKSLLHQAFTGQL